MLERTTLRIASLFLIFATLTRSTGTPTINNLREAASGDEDRQHLSGHGGARRRWNNDTGWISEQEQDAISAAERRGANAWTKQIEYSGKTFFDGCATSLMDSC